MIASISTWSKGIRLYRRGNWWSSITGLATELTFDDDDDEVGDEDGGDDPLLEIWWPPAEKYKKMWY